MPLGEGRLRHGATILLRGLEEQVRGGAESVSPCQCLLRLRGAAAGQTRGSRTKHSGACVAGHLQGGSQGPTQDMGYLGPPPQSYSPCSYVLGLVDKVA